MNHKLQEKWSSLNESKGMLYVERDPSLGHYRIKFWCIRLFWKWTKGWEICFVEENEKFGVQLVICDDYHRPDYKKYREEGE